MKTSTKWLTAAAALLALCAAGCGVSARQEALPERRLRPQPATPYRRKVRLWST